MNKKIARVGGKDLALSNLEKDLYPSYGFTKAQIIEYYRQISAYILPHLKGRALTLKRYPDGADEEFFFEKRCPAHRPTWVETAVIRRENGERMRVCLANDLSTLVWVENLASIELHVPMAKADSPGTPDSMVFDLDPGEKAGILDCARVALIIKDLLARSRLAGYVKTSGKKGLHLCVPLNRKDATFEHTKQFSKTVAEVLQRNYPDLVTAKMAKEYRNKKVFINWSQNDPSKTMVCVYSLRAGDKPTVSFPVSWRELQAAARLKDVKRLQILHSEAVSRLKKSDDLFKDLIAKKQRLPNQ